MLCIALKVGAHGQPAAPSVAGSLEGRITSSDGYPARFATVHLVPLAKLLAQEGAAHAVPKAPRDVRTDLNGDYGFLSVQPGTYLVEALKDGYSPELPLLLQSLDKFAPAQQKELLAAFPQVTVTSGGASRADVVIHRGAAISGQVSFDTGGVLSDAEVTATLISTGLFGLHDDGSDSSQALNFTLDTKTDDRGVYRIRGAPAGTYRIDVDVDEGGMQQWGVDTPTRVGTAVLTVSAPDALSATDARPVKVADGDEQTGIDITIPMRLLHSVAGVVTRRGVPVERAHVTIRPAAQPKPQTWTWSAPTISDGSYRIDLVPSGTYILEATFSPAAPGRSSTTRQITVTVGDGDVLDANINLPAREP